MADEKMTKALEIVATAWCTPETERITMDVKLAQAFADTLVKYL